MASKIDAEDFDKHFWLELKNYSMKVYFKTPTLHMHAQCESTGHRILHVYDVHVAILHTDFMIFASLQLYSTCTTYITVEPLLKETPEIRTPLY